MRRHSNLKIVLACLVAFFLGLILRLFNRSWDGGFYLNPDERFLAMVVGGLKLPPSLGVYLNPHASLLNPYNTNNPFFVYGHFPITLLKYLAVLLNYDNYGVFYLLSRTITAIMDASVILAVFFSALKLFQNHAKGLRIAVYSALCYALFALPIQQAHFFTTDSFVTAFFAWAFCLALYSENWLKLTLSAVMFGLGLASKVNMVYSAPLLGLIIAHPHWKKPSLIVFKGALYGAISYLTLRLADPYIFKEASWLNLALSQQYLDNLKQLAAFGKNAFFPPALQWVGKDFLFPLRNLMYFGVGSGFFLLALMGVWHVIHSQKKAIWIYILLWVIAFYAYLGLQLGRSMRYYLFLYPVIALLAGTTLYHLKRPLRVMAFVIASIWTFAFMYIYTVPHSRLTASAWLNEYLPANSRIVWEYWDDPLPLSVDPQKNFKLMEINFYETDSKQKWQIIVDKLRYTDYIVLSSNRLHGTLRYLPEVYPQTSRYYNLLLENQLGFKLVKEFHVYPTLALGSWKFEFPDQWAEEAFTVYDHPQVLVFKKENNFKPAYFLKQLDLK